MSLKILDPTTNYAFTSKLWTASAHTWDDKKKKSCDSSKRRRQKNNLKKDFTKERKKSISKKNHWGGENSLITHKIFNEMIYFKSLDYFTSKT